MKREIERARLKSSIEELSLARKSERNRAREMQRKRRDETHRGNEIDLERKTRSVRE